MEVKSLRTSDKWDVRPSFNSWTLLLSWGISLMYWCWSLLKYWLVCSRKLKCVLSRTGSLGKFKVEMVWFKFKIGSFDTLNVWVEGIGTFDGTDVPRKFWAAFVDVKDVALVGFVVKVVVTGTCWFSALRLVFVGGVWNGLLGLLEF